MIFKRSVISRNAFVTATAVVVTVILFGSAALSIPKGATIRPNATVTCSTTTPCEVYSNTSSGVGVKGTSVTGNGVSGSSTKLNGIVGSEAAVYPSPTPTGIFFGRSGVVGNDTSTDFLEQGVLGTSLNGTGVAGTAVNGDAVLGYTSSAGTSSGSGSGVFGLEQATSAPDLNSGTVGWALGGTGVFGRTKNESTVQANGQAGVAGIDSATTSTYNVAVTGLSGIGTGGYFESRSGPGGSFQSTTGVGAFSQTTSGTGLIALATDGTALAAQTQGPGVGTDTSVLSLDSANGAPLIVADGPSKPAMSLDANGNMILRGSLTQHGSPIAVQQSSTGVSYETYSPIVAEATIEDVGEATLVDGVANVRLEPTFASTMDVNKGYIVFLQPEGMVQGNLCVISRTADGFSVRESGAGRSSVAFAYRIVGHPYGSDEQRLPFARLPQALQRHPVLPDWSSRVRAFQLKTRALAQVRPGLQ
jgi:hypothetical protein